MATKTEINFTELIDLSLGTPEVVNYKGLRVLLAAIVSQLGVNVVNLELSDYDKRQLIDVKEGKSNEKHDTQARPATGTGGGGAMHQTNEMDKSRSVTITDGTSGSPGPGGGSVPQIIHDMEKKMSQIEGQLSVLNSLPSNQSLKERTQSGSNEKTTPVSDMWQLMQCQKKTAANEEGVSKLMSMVEDMMRELQGLNAKLDKHTSDISELQDKHSDMLNKYNEFKNNIDKINGNVKTVEDRLDKLETSAGDKEKLDELQRLMDYLRNQLASLPAVEEIVTWPDFESALKGHYKEPIPQLDSGMQTAPMLENTRMQTAPLHDASIQTVTPTPPTPSPPASRPVSSKSVRSAFSTSSNHPSNELQKVLKDLGELTGKHNLLEDRVKGLEELLAKKADMSEVEAMLAQWNVPADLMGKLAELEEGLNHLRDSKSKLDDLERRLREQSQVVPASLADIEALRHDLEQAIADLAESQDALARDVSQIGMPGANEEEGMGEPSQNGIDATMLNELERRLESSLQLLSNTTKSLEKSLNKQLADLASQIDALANQPVKVRSAPRVERVVEQIVTESSVDSQSIQDLQNSLMQLQDELDKLNKSYVHLVDEHNVKQKHIDALYTFVDRLQENKADKEHVIMEIDVKADKRSLENKVSRSHFDGTVDELSRNLHDVMEKMAGHRVAWDSAVSELKLDIDNKLDRMELDPLKSYLDNRIKSVSKVVRKEAETGEDAAGFRRPLQKFHCISCDRPLDMAPQPPIASLPENKGLPGNRTGRPYTTFELEQIRAAQKNARPGRNVHNYERTLFKQELARRRRQEIMAYLVSVNKTRAFSMGIEHRVKPGVIPPIKNLHHLHTYDYKVDESGQFQDVPDYFITSRSCGGSHTMTYPHRRITRISQMTNTVTTTEDIAPMINGRMEADIEGQDGHIYKARLEPGSMSDRLPTLSHPKTPSSRIKSPRVGSARGRRPNTRHGVEPLEHNNNNNNNKNNFSMGPPPLGQPRPSSARGGPDRPSSPRLSKSMDADLTRGRKSPQASPPTVAGELDSVVNGGGGNGIDSDSQPPPPTSRNTTEAITVPQPPPEVQS